MKVLTIKQPWASSIMQNNKKYEFRSWKTNYRGELLNENEKIYKNVSCKRDYAWKLDNVEIFSNTIEVKGQLGLWNYEL